MMTYEQFRAKRQKEYDALPIHYAFSEGQLNAVLEAHNETRDNIRPLFGGGSFCFSQDYETIINSILFRNDDELDELMKDRDFAIHAFNYEMWNHEYGYDLYEGDYRVCSCFVNGIKYSETKDYEDYLTEAKAEHLIPYYKEALKSYYKDFEG